MNILHISNAFAQSRLYTQIVFALDNLNIEQVIYSAVRTGKESDFAPKELIHITKHIKHILNVSDRVLYRKKIKKIFDNLIDLIDITNIDCLHAHTLYSDGGVALKLNYKFKIPYIVAIRNTDINIFMKYRPDLNRIRDEILLNANRVIIISPAYRKKIQDLLPKDIMKVVGRKIAVIPNGIAPEWLNSNAPIKNRVILPKIRLLYVGQFTKNKNIISLIRAVSLLAKTHSISLTLVGGGGNHHNKILKMVNSGDYKFVQYIGQIDDLDRLREVYLTHDIFAMPSFHETFGLVYIEALSQGLPILYSKGEGIDGYFPAGSICEAVNPRNIKELSDKILSLANRMRGLRCKCIEQSQRFNWANIALQYQAIYKQCLLNRGEINKSSSIDNKGIF